MDGKDEDSVTQLLVTNAFESNANSRVSLYFYQLLTQFGLIFGLDSTYKLATIFFAI